MQAGLGGLGAQSQAFGEFVDGQAFDVAQDWLSANCGTISSLYVIAEDTVITDADVDDLVDTASDCPEER